MKFQFLPINRILEKLKSRSAAGDGQKFIWDFIKHQNPSRSNGRIRKGVTEIALKICRLEWLWAVHKGLGKCSFNFD